MSDEFLRKICALGAFSAITLIMLVVIVAASHTSGDSSFPVIAVGGAVLLIAVLAAIALSFSLAGISDNRYAFGLPDGSIRAMLAMGLFAAFVGTAGFLYTGLAHPTTSTALGGYASEQEIQDLSKTVVVLRTGPTVEGRSPINVYLRPDPAASDLAKQIFTTVATALVTIIGFYFGSGSLASAVAAVRSATAPLTTDAERASAAEVNAARVRAYAKDASVAIAAACTAASETAKQASEEVSKSVDFNQIRKNLEDAAAKGVDLGAAVMASLDKVAVALVTARKADTADFARQENMKVVDTALAEARANFDKLTALRNDVDQWSQKMTVLVTTSTVTTPAAAGDTMGGVQSRPGETLPAAGDQTSPASMTPGAT